MPEMIRPQYGRGPAPWESAAPRARHVGGKFFNAPNSGSGMNFNRPWHGDVETQTPTLNRMTNFVQRNVGNYMLYRTAVMEGELAAHHQEDKEEKGATSRLGAPNTGSAAPQGPTRALNMGARPMPGPSKPLALGAGPSVIPVRETGPIDRPMPFGARGPRTADDARREAGGGSLNYPQTSQVAPNAERRKGTGANPSKLKSALDGLNK